MDGLACMESQCAGFAMSSLSIPDFDPALILLPEPLPQFCDGCSRTCTFAPTGLIYCDFRELECTGCGDKRRVRFTRERS